MSGVSWTLYPLFLCWVSQYPSGAYKKHVSLVLPLYRWANRGVRWLGILLRVAMADPWLPRSVRLRVSPSSRSSLLAGGTEVSWSDTFHRGSWKLKSANRERKPMESLICNSDFCFSVLSFPLQPRCGNKTSYAIFPSAKWKCGLLQKLWKISKWCLWSWLFI